MRENFLAYLLGDELFTETPPQVHDAGPDVRSLRLATRGNGECGHRRSIVAALWLGVPQSSIEDTLRQ